MKLRKFLKKYYPNLNVRYNHSIENITDYDKDVMTNGVFVSLSDLTYIENAVNLGAKTIVLNSKYKKSKFTKSKKVNYLFVDSPIVFLARIIREVISNLDKKPIIVGITGTSGKTTSLNILYEVLKKENYDVLAVGTHFVYSYYGLIEEKSETNNTTLSLSKLYTLLKKKNFDYDYLIMEVSSEGIMKSRILGLEFDVVSITNITSDHMNYHKTKESYIHAKERLLYHAAVDLIFNNDDEVVRSFKELTIKNIITYGINSGDVTAKYLNLDTSQTEFYIEDNKINYYIKTNLLGEFNVYNILNVWCILKSLKIDPKLLIKILNHDQVIPGRMNKINKGNICFIVDYAHTVNEVEAVLTYFNKIKGNNKLITIIGCGGSRDKTKRSIIGSYVCNQCDYVYFTEDNSRDENVDDIISDMVRDIKTTNCEIIKSRKECIKKAYLDNLNNNAVILVLGKGNEQYHIILSNYLKYYNDIEEINNL